jgi:hypothetical protein
MVHRFTYPPISDFNQEWHWHNPRDPWRPWLNLGDHRNAPNEPPWKQWDPENRGWHQGSRRLRNFRPDYYFTRPCDGKRRGTTGRLKDALTGEGPDVFITISGDKRTLMRDRPQRRQWAGWPETRGEWLQRHSDRNWRPQDDEPVYRWHADRANEPHYNFRSREFQSTQRVMNHPWSAWTNAQWPERASHDNMNPRNYRDARYQWFTRVSPWAGLWPGGRPRPPVQ